MGRRVRRGYGTSSSYSDNKAWRSPAIKIRYANSPAYFSIMLYCVCRLLHAKRTLERLDELIPQEWMPRMLQIEVICDRGVFLMGRKKTNVRTNV